MNSSASKSLDIPTGPGLPRWLLRGLIAALALLVLGLLALAFLLGRDDDKPVAATPVAPLQAAAVTAAPQATADSAVVEEQAPVSTRRMIMGEEVDANGDSKNPDLARPGDDSSYLNDSDDGKNHSGKDETP